jgi:Terminase large subunit, T4likevirus-type, N-terminal/Terminase RNaseH-like domain
MSKDLETAIIRSPYKAMSMTEHEIREFARCADPVTGPEYFMTNYFFIQHPVRGSIQYKPYEYQIRLINAYHNNRFLISLMPRQTGKTISAAGYLLWFAMFVPDSTILVAAHKYLGAQEIMQRIRYSYENCPDFIRAGVTSYNKGSLDFENGSRIVSQTTTENTGRGMSISLLYCDEFAFVRPTIASEFWTSITPTLATGGKCIITSTPNSDEDQFAQIWRSANDTFDEYGNSTVLGKNGFKAFTSKWQETPGRDEAWAKQMQAQLGEERFRREILCEFVIFDETLINPLHLIEMSGVEPIERQGQVRWYKKPEKNCTYVVALDPSLGTGGDPAAIQVFELPGLKQVAEWSHNKTIIQRQVVIMKEICAYLSEIVGNTNVYYSVENNTLGEAALVCIAQMGEENIPGTFLSEPKSMGGGGGRFRRGFNTTHKSKLAACAKLKSLIETNRMRVSSKILISELKNFVAKGNSYEAKIGEHDDLVMALILIIRMIQHIQNFDASTDNEIRDRIDEFIEPMPFVMVSSY